MGATNTALCFAALDEAEIEQCSRRCGEGIKAFWEIKDIAKLDEILKDQEIQAQAHSPKFMTALGGMGGC